MIAAADPRPAAAPASEGPIVLYDGSCGLCARSVRFILRHERDHALRFAPLQGETTAALRVRYPEIPRSVSTVVYIEHGKAHVRSKAFLYLAHHLRAPWRWAHWFRWLPGIVLDLGYRGVAALRYRIWGRAEACELVSPAQRARLLP